jgi:hypothetical protein
VDRADEAGADNHGGDRGKRVHGVGRVTDYTGFDAG